jgi:hypothetical protein
LRKFSLQSEKSFVSVTDIQQIIQYLFQNHDIKKSKMDSHCSSRLDKGLSVTLKRFLQIVDYIKHNSNHETLKYRNLERFLQMLCIENMLSCHRIKKNQSKEKEELSS